MVIGVQHMERKTSPVFRTQVRPTANGSQSLETVTSDICGNSADSASFERFKGELSEEIPQIERKTSLDESSSERDAYQFG